jgi:hypothetical protein
MCPDTTVSAAAAAAADDDDDDDDDDVAVAVSILMCRVGPHTTISLVCFEALRSLFGLRAM